MTNQEFETALQQLNQAKSTWARPDALHSLQNRTSARIGVGRSGHRPSIDEWLRFRVDHAAARDSIYKQVEMDAPLQVPFTIIQSSVENKEEYLLRPDLGRKVHSTDLHALQKEEFRNQDVLLLVGDGLSAYAIEENLVNILPSVQSALKLQGRMASNPIFIRYARVGIMDHIGELLHPKTVILLIGERPGLRTARSMSAYLCYQPNLHTIESDRDVISNIHPGGLPAVEAGAMVADLIAEYFQYRCSGMKLRKAKMESTNR